MPSLIEPVCQASFIRYTLASEHGKNRLLFSNPAHEKSRINGTIRLSYDEGKTWSVAKTLYPGDFAYSCLTLLQDMSIGCLYEKNDYKSVTFARVTLVCYRLSTTSARSIISCCSADERSTNRTLKPATRTTRLL